MNFDDFTRDIYPVIPATLDLPAERILLEHLRKDLHHQYGSALDIYLHSEIEQRGSAYVLGYCVLESGEEFDVIHYRGQVILGKTHKFGIAVKVPAQRLEKGVH